MDRSALCVDFFPYEEGIIDTIAQMLLPNSSGYEGITGIYAELYNLNIYAAPSGFFKSHVDTPRSSAQFGSLVVSLPCYHTGGQLVVQHAGNSQTFDWGSDGQESFKPCIKWAAFYSDCEHEVLEVTNGHRITLTYNLYHSPGVGNMTDYSEALEMTSIPLFHHVQDMLKKSDFMPDGGQLDIYYQHYYAHTHCNNAEAFLAILKGSDMAVYTVFKALNLNLEVRAILDITTDEFQNYLDTEEALPQEHKPDYLYEDTPWPPLFRTHSVVGELGGRWCCDVVVEEHEMDKFVQFWSDDYRMVEWVNEPQCLEIDMYHATYGNQPGIRYMYSHAAILVAVPPASERGVLGSTE
ncbi:P4Hc domain containing protein [Pyrenophora tritici-repentis]|nr:P4Hc domain containing protein [Pyrenophora tritici-repentis]